MFQYSFLFLFPFFFLSFFCPPSVLKSFGIRLIVYFFTYAIYSFSFQLFTLSFMCLRCKIIITVIIMLHYIGFGSTGLPAGSGLGASASDAFASVGGLTSQRSSNSMSSFSSFNQADNTSLPAQARQADRMKQGGLLLFVIKKSMLSRHHLLLLWQVAVFNLYFCCCCCFFRLICFYPLYSLDIVLTLKLLP